MTGLAGKRALITGGGRGIGAAITRRLAADGAAVAINYRADRAAAEDLAHDINQLGGTAITVHGDLSVDGVAHDLAQQTASVFGGIDILVSNAGIEHFGALETITRADIDRVFGVNVAGQLFAVQAAVEHMGPGGRVVVTSSVSARIAVTHHTLYAASKAAVSAMALNLAPELADRSITINAIAPRRNPHGHGVSARVVLHPTPAAAPVTAGARIAPRCTRSTSRTRRDRRDRRVSCLPRRLLHHRVHPRDRRRLDVNLVDNRVSADTQEPR